MNYEFNRKPVIILSCKQLKGLLVFNRPNLASTDFKNYLDVSEYYPERQNDERKVDQTCPSSTRSPQGEREETQVVGYGRVHADGGSCF